jgi:hypothetical protein
MFNTGQKVVCVDDRFPDSVLTIYQQLPTKNQVYVVRATRAGVNADSLLMDHRRVIQQSLLLCGITNPTNNLGVEYGFNSERFRALEEMQESAKWGEQKVETSNNQHRTSSIQ